MRNNRIHVMIDRRLTSDEKKALNNSDTLDGTPPIHLPAPNGHYSYAPTAQQHASPGGRLTPRMFEPVHPPRRGQLLQPVAPPGCSSPSSCPKETNCYSPGHRPGYSSPSTCPKGANCYSPGQRPGYSSPYSCPKGTNCYSPGQRPGCSSPSSCPKGANCYSPGQRPGSTAPTFPSPEGAIHLRTQRV